MSDIITAENLQLWYGDTHALKGIDMAIPEKNITAPHRALRLRKVYLSENPEPHERPDPLGADYRGGAL